MASRPFKVWSGDRRIKKSVTASSFQELLEKGCLKLNFDASSQPRVVLEEDGTEVDEEDYFALLPKHSTFLFLTNSEQWKPLKRESAVRDEADCPGGDGSMTGDVHILAQSLKMDVSNILTFTSEQLQKIVDCETSVLAHLLGETERYTSSVKAACQRHLDECAQSQEAIDLLKLYHQAYKTSSASTDDQDSSVVKGVTSYNTAW